MDVDEAYQSNSDTSSTVSVTDVSLSGSSNLRSERDYVHVECDLAYTHKRNEELRGQIQSRAPRVTRWTGYEVWASDDLALWIVFDGGSLASEDKAWYPVSCSLTEFIKPPSGFARLLPSLTELEHATFEYAKSLVVRTYLPGEMRLEQVEKSEVKERERDQTSTPLPRVYSSNKGKQRADNTAIGDVQTVHPPWSRTPSDTTGVNQDIPLVGQRGHTTTPRTMVSVHSLDSRDNDTEVTQVRSKSSSSDAEYAQTTKLQLGKSAIQDQPGGGFRLPIFEQSLASALEAQLQRLKSFRPGKKSGSSEVENLFTKDEIQAALSYALRESRNPRRHSSQPDLPTGSMEDASKLLYQHR